jgi:signal transduction histidine kinase
VGAGALVGVTTAVVLFTVLVVGVILSAFVVGLTVLAASALTGLVVAPIERFRLRLVDKKPIPGPHRTPPHRGFRSWLVTRYREPATWRELADALITSALGPGDALILVFGAVFPIVLIGAPVIVALDPRGSAVSFGPNWKVDTVPQALWLVPIGLILLVVLAYVWTLWAAARAALTRYLLSPRESEMGARVVALTRSRARLVDAFEAERRRIERDLHDGAQQRLVALSVELGLAKLDLPPDSPATPRVARAHEQAKLALAELRELIRGVHPQVLTDRGLRPAIEDVAGRSPVPVTIDILLPERPPAEVEAAAYFVVTEALANIARHSQAVQARVSGRVEAGTLVVEVSDDGVGGANPANGTGLQGLGDRVAVVDGMLTLSSPPGGPTRLRVELPAR